MATSTRSFNVSPPSVRNAECGIDGEGPIPETGDGARRPRAPFRIPPHSALESPMQDGGQLPDLVDDLWQGSDERVHVLRRVLLTEREAQRVDAQLARHAHSRED